MTQVRKKFDTEHSVKMMHIAFYTHGDKHSPAGIARGNKAIKDVCNRLMPRVTGSTRHYVKAIAADRNQIDLIERAIARTTESQGV